MNSKKSKNIKSSVEKIFNSISKYEVDKRLNKIPLSTERKGKGFIN